MAEKEQTKSEEKKPQKKKSVEEAPAFGPKKEKAKWTVERCKKAAFRFTSVKEWEHGAPASFKAAHAKGWVAECSSHMKSQIRRIS